MFDDLLAVAFTEAKEEYIEKYGEDFDYLETVAVMKYTKEDFKWFVTFDKHCPSDKTWIFHKYTDEDQEGIERWFNMTPEEFCREVLCAWDEDWNSEYYANGW